MAQRVPLSPTHSECEIKVAFFFLWSDYSFGSALLVSPTARPETEINGTSVRSSWGFYRPRSGHYSLNTVPIPLQYNDKNALVHCLDRLCPWDGTMKNLKCSVLLICHKNLTAHSFLQWTSFYSNCLLFLQTSPAQLPHQLGDLQKQLHKIFECHEQTVPTRVTAFFSKLRLQRLYSRLSGR